MLRPAFGKDGLGVEPGQTGHAVIEHHEIIGRCGLGHARERLREIGGGIDRKAALGLQV